MDGDIHQQALERYEAIAAGMHANLRAIIASWGPPAQRDDARCAHCGAAGELEWTVYDRWQCVNLSECAKRQLAAREP